jgi:ABC-type enterobactin transport system permease subunit
VWLGKDTLSIHKQPYFQFDTGWPVSCFCICEEEDIMHMAITFMAVVGGMVFSLAVALLAEELIFGQVFRLFFASGKLPRQAVAVKSEQKR